MQQSKNNNWRKFFVNLIFLDQFIFACKCRFLFCWIATCCWQQKLFQIVYSTKIHNTIPPGWIGSFAVTYPNENRVSIQKPKTISLRQAPFRWSWSSWLWYVRGCRYRASFTTVNYHYDSVNCNLIEKHQNMFFNLYLIILD